MHIIIQYNLSIIIIIIVKSVLSAIICQWLLFLFLKHICGDGCALLVHSFSGVITILYYCVIYIKLK